MPTEEDIANLKLGNMSAEQFDAKYGAGASQTYLQVNQEPSAEVKEPESRITEIPEQLMGAAVDTTQEVVNTIAGLGDIVDDKFNLEQLSATIREKALEKGINIPIITIDDGKFSVRSGQEAIDYIRAKKDKPDAKSGITKLAELYEKTTDDAKEFYGIDEPEYLHGTMIKGVSQFLLGFLGGKKLLDGAGWATKKLTKEQTKAQLLKNTTSNLGKSMTAAAIADAVVFDEHMPRLSDMAVEYGFDNALTSYLASDPNDSFAEGKFKNALEGFLIGLPLEGLFSSVRYLKLRKDRSAGKKVSTEQINKDEKAIETIQEEIADNIDSVSRGEAPNNVRVDFDVDPKQSVKGVDISQANKDALKEKLADANMGYGKDGLNSLLKNIESYRKGELDLDEALDIGINGKNLNDLPETHIILADIVSGLQSKNYKAYDEIEPHTLVEKRAELLMQDPFKTMQSISKLATQIDGASKYIVAGLSMAQSYANALPKIARLIEASKNPANGVTTKWTEKDFDKVVDILATLLLDEKIIERNVGRMLNAKNIKVTSADVNIDSVMKEIELVKNYGGDKQRFMRRIALVDNPNAVMKLLRAVLSNKSWNLANEVWINFLLSSPKTHLVNMTSNFIMAVVRPAEQYIGAKALKLVTGDKYYANVADEALDIYSGLVMYTNDARKYAVQAFKQEQGILDSGLQKSEGLGKTTGTGKVGNFLRVSTRALNAEDEFFKQMNYRAKLYSIAVRTAKNLNLSKVKDKSLNGKPVSDFELKVAEIFEGGFKDGVGTNKEALDWARVNTFTDELLPDSYAGMLQKYSINNPWVKQIIPFIRTPTNIASSVIQRIPIANQLSRRYKNAARSNNPYQKAQAMGGQILGTSLLITASLLAKGGMLTGGGYQDYKLKREQKRAGFKPYSFKFGDTYISYQRLDPFGMFFGLVADYNEMFDEMSEKEKAIFAESSMTGTISNFTVGQSALILNTFVKNIASKTYIKGLSDMMDALMDGSPSKMNKVIKEKMASMIIPNVASKFKFDQVHRSTRTFMDTIAARTPYFSKFVEPRYNWLGEPDIRQGGFWSDLLLPITAEKTKKDKLHEVIANMKQPIAPVAEVINGVDLTQYKLPNGDSAYRVLNENIAKSPLRSMLESLVNDPSFDKNYTDNIFFDEQTKFKGTKTTAIMELINRVRRDELDRIKGMTFKSPNGEEVTLGAELDKMRDNKEMYKKGAPPEALRGLL